MLMRKLRNRDAQAKGSSSEGSELQRKGYVEVGAKLPERQNGTPVRVTITAPSRPTKPHILIDVVLVLHIHTRCRTPPNWHDLLIQAANLTIDNLREDDRLAIVPALLKETKIILGNAKIVPVEPKLLPMNSENKIAASNSVEFSEAMKRNTPLMRDLESAESILYGREPTDKEKRAGYIIVISNSDDDMSSVLTWRFPSVHAFGFCDARNARTMYSIASSRKSTYGILDEGGLISSAFNECINKITCTADLMTVKLKCKQDVVLLSILGPRISYFISYDKKVAIIWANTHPEGTVASFIVYLDIPGDYYGDLLNVQVTYGQHPNSIKLNGAPLVTVSKGKNGSTKEVAAEVLRVEAVKIIADIVAQDRIDDHEKQLNAAADELRARWKKLVESHYGREANEAGLLSGIDALMQRMEARLRKNNLWLEYMLSWLSRQCWPLQPLNMDGVAALSGRLGDRPHMIESESSEITEATTDDHLGLRVLAKVDTVPALVRKPELGLPVLVHVMLPVKELEEQKRVPLDLVALLDVSCGGSEMMKKKMKLLTKAMGFVMERLSHKDRLAIIPVQSTVILPVIGLLQMTVKRRAEYTKMISVMTTASKAGQQTLYERKNLKKRTMCFPNAAVASSSRKAISGSTKLSKSLNGAIKLLDDRQADDKDRMGVIMVVSDSDDIWIPHRVLSTKYTIHAFSFCGADNARALHRIASSSSGIYAVVNDSHDEITEAFKACIRKITSTTVVNTKVHILCKRSSSMKLSTIESGQFKSSIGYRKKTGTIFAGALYPGAERRFVAYLKDIRDDEYADLPEMLAVNVTWQHGSNRVNEKLDGHVDIVWGEASEEVVQEIVRIQASKIVSAITDPETQTEPVLGRVQELIRSSNTGADDDIDESIAGLVIGGIHSPSLSNMLSWLSFQGLCEKPPSATS